MLPKLVGILSSSGWSIYKFAFENTTIAVFMNELRIEVMIN